MPVRKPNNIDVPSIESIKPKYDATIVRQVREYELITPLFGGSATPGKCDKDYPIRGTEIRGHLRFWWRACRGGQFNGSLADMKAAEDAIWGAAANDNDNDKDKDKEKKGQSKVQVIVTEASLAKDPLKVTHSGRDINVGDPRSPYSYVAFPLRDSGGVVYEDGVFTLVITFPEAYRTDVKAALWAWETFGGIGARTRRGFGALRCVNINENGENKPLELPSSHRADVEKWLLQKFKDFVCDGTLPKDVPHLQHRPLFFVSRSNPDALETWKNLFGRLKKFRQQRTNKNTGQSSEYGYSDWPEANAIRRLLGKNPRGTHANQNTQKFPRGVFGLPLIYHLEHDPAKPNVTLQGKDKDKERLASPLILRPLACSDRKYVGIALILAGSRLPENLMLKGEGIPDSTVPDTQLTSAEANKISVLNGNTDVLQAFLDTLNA